jgi:hypothetical protein
MAPTGVTHQPSKPRLLNREECMEALVLLGVAREFRSNRVDPRIWGGSVSGIAQNIREFFAGLDESNG